MMKTEELISQSQRGDQHAKEQLVLENAGLIWSVTKRFIGRGVEPDDLYQLGCLGFIKAVDGFDLQYGTQFSTYAVPKIAGEIRRFLRDNGAVKVSRSVKEQAVRIHTTQNSMRNILGREPTVTEIAQQTGLTPEQIALAENAVVSVESIHNMNGEDGFTLEHILSDTESEERMLEKVALRQAIQKLPERERLVIHLRYFHGLTQERVARILEVSQVQVSRIEKKALSLLRDLLH